MSGFQRYLLGVQYIGTKYSGWARNTESVLPSLENTVQLALDKFTIGGDNNRNFKGSSR